MCSTNWYACVCACVCLCVCVMTIMKLKLRLFDQMVRARVCVCVHESTPVAGVLARARACMSEGACVWVCVHTPPHLLTCIHAPAHPHTHSQVVDGDELSITGRGGECVRVFTARWPARPVASHCLRDRSGAVVVSSVDGRATLTLCPLRRRMSVCFQSPAVGESDTNPIWCVHTHIRTPNTH